MVSERFLSCFTLWFFFLHSFSPLSSFFFLAMAAESFTTIDLTQTSSSVYFLHPSNYSSIKRVSTPFDGIGFSAWKRSMLISLISKNKKCFINGSLNKPFINSSELKAWKRCNTMVIGWLKSSLDHSVAKSVMYHNDARDIWKNLEDRFSQTEYVHCWILHQSKRTLVRNR